jgi:hypothetical protein
MILDVANYRLLGSARIVELKKPHRFLHLNFYNEEIDALKINNILNHINVQSCNPHNFRMKSTPCISYKYTSTITSKLFIYKQTLQCVDIEQIRPNPSKCSCSSSQFNYSPAVYFITGDVNIVKQWWSKVFVFKNYYYECLLNKLGFTFTPGTTTYTPTNLTKDDILQNNLSV